MTAAADKRDLGAARDAAVEVVADHTLLRILSYGGGTQSAALALMSAAGLLPKLDGVIFADTHGELPETYVYADYVERILADAGIPFHRISAGSLEEALLSPVRTMHNPTPPAHVVNPDGSRGRINAYRCSYDYKRRIITRETKRLCGGRGAWKRANEPRGHVPACTDCACQAFDPWRLNVWPLLPGFRREDTIRWFAENGHPTPPRSACWFCPNQRDGRWAALKETHPDLFERACKLDEHIRHGAACNARGNQPFAGQMFLHESRIPLREVDLRSKAQKDAAAGQFGLFDEVALAADCEGGVCFT